MDETLKRVADFLFDNIWYLMSYVLAFIGYLLSMLSILIAYAMVVLGKIQMWLGLAFMPFGLAAWLIDRGSSLARMISFYLTGMGTFIIAALLVQTSAEAYANGIAHLVTSQINNARAAGGEQAAASAAEHLSFADVMIAAFSILYAVFLIGIVKNAAAWAEGIFGGLAFSTDTPRVRLYEKRKKDDDDDKKNGPGGGGPPAPPPSRGPVRFLSAPSARVVDANPERIPPGLPNRSPARPRLTAPYENVGTTTYTDEAGNTRTAEVLSPRRSGWASPPRKPDSPHPPGGPIEPNSPS